MAAESNGKDESFVSSLSEGRQAFLAEISQFALALKERSPEDFISHFSCEKIMQALKERPQERAVILKEATGTHERIAPRMSPEAAGETLQIALDERVTHAGQILELFVPDDRQRYLDSAALWAFTVSGEPEKKTRKGADLERSKKFIGYLLERALHHKLLDQKELIQALTVSRLTTLLPPQLLAAIIEASLEASGKFSHADLVGVAPPEKLVSHVPLDYIWEKVVVVLVAERNGYVGGGESESATPESQPSAMSASSNGSSSGSAVEVEIGDEAAEQEALDAASDLVDAQELGPDEDVVLDDDDEEVHTVTDDDDVFDDLLDDGLSDTEASSGPSVKRAGEEEDVKKNASAN